eukprot:TRINITY_DN2631_c0_g1_i5.p1 TRINITY_DN2631_c0_g1~~TRINITY_DN2631_c0_g1_i5.p1  ORF type:complete len:136 (-),score=31.33 TRINITY_DN2631_c0_g1_i5:263-670(-)
MSDFFDDFDFDAPLAGVEAGPVRNVFASRNARPLAKDEDRSGGETTDSIGESPKASAKAEVARPDPIAVSSSDSEEIDILAGPLEPLHPKKETPKESMKMEFATISDIDSESRQTIELENPVLVFPRIVSVKRIR